MKHANGAANGFANGNGAVKGGKGKGKREWWEEGTDHARWRMKDVRGVQTWHYLESEEECEKWPQSTADKWYLGMDTGLPELPPARTPAQAISNGLAFYKELQQDVGNWACEYGGPMFLLPGLIITWYVTETPIPRSHSVEIARYLFARQNPEDGGWGLHIEGESSVFGTAMNYTALRILGVDAEHERMVKARAKLWKLGGALKAPHWAKFWLAVLGVLNFDVVNPVPPELWLLPNWVPIHPWKWWVHMRTVFIPMGYIYSQRWSYPLNDLTKSLRSELLVEPYESINFIRHRNDICPIDNYHPKSLVLRLLFWFLVYIWFPYLRPASLKKKAEEHAWWLIQREDENTDYANLGPVNGPLNTIASYIRLGRDSVPFQEHLKTLPEFLWVKDEGMLMNGTNGLQVWDTAFSVQAIKYAGLLQDSKYHDMLQRALEFLEDQQIPEECRDQHLVYRQSRKGAWGFSNRKQGYTVSDCTSEGLKAVLLLQTLPEFPKLVSDRRIKDAIDILLTMQNRSGGCASYEPTRGSQYLEYLNAAEVFGRIMIEYDYPECTTAVITALHMFQAYDASYRADEIAAFKARALDYIRKSQAPDGSWYGAWGICFTYAGMFALDSLACGGETYANSERVRRGCQFFLDRQMEDGGWGETYRACETGTWCNHEKSQVVATSWALIGLCHAEYPHKEPLRKALEMIVRRQQSNGEWLQEAIEGVFNKSCMISYPNYKFIFPIMALGMYKQRFGDDPLF